MAAHGHLVAAGRLTINVNRYCLLLILPVCILFGVFGHDILSLWINPGVAANTMPILLPLLIGAGVIASQFNSSSVLYGLAGHRRYARGFAVEAVVGVAAMLLIGPRLGTVGLAWVVMIVGSLNRGLFTSWLVCQRLNLSWRDFLVSIYVRPLIAGGLALGAAWLIRSRLAAEIGVIELLTIAAMVMALYGVLCWAMCIPREHRAIFYREIRRMRPQMNADKRRYN
jgi:O-antigen/teichoic acid export membrane protein